MIYKIIQNEDDLKKALEEYKSKPFGFAYITDFSLAEELNHKLRPYNEAMKVSDKPYKEVHVKNDKASICLGWLIDIRLDDKDEPYVSDVHTTPDYIVTYKDVMFRPAWNRKAAPTWSILSDSANYEYMPYNERYESEGKPKRMGTITERGMEEWYQYLMKRHNRAKAIESQKNDAWNTFLSRIQTIADRYGLANDCTKKNKYGTFYLDKYHKNGWITLNAIQIHFSCDSGGHISQKVELAPDFVLADDKKYGDMLDRFMRITNNDWSK